MGAFAGIAFQILLFAAESLEGLMRLGNLSAERLNLLAAPIVQNIEVACHHHERLMFVLPVQVYQPFAHLFELGDGGGASGDTAGRLPGSGHLP